jgi:hypothetical protein
MIDDEARAPVNDAPPAGEPGERNRRSRRRGKRSKNKPAEVQQSAVSDSPAAVQPPERPTAASAPPRGSRKAAAPRSGFQPFNDGLDRFVCSECHHFLPEGYPVQHRRGVATVPMQQVDRRDAELLLCNLLHDGPCTWPDGEVVMVVAADPAPDRQDEIAEVRESAITSPAESVEAPGEDQTDKNQAGDDASASESLEHETDVMQLAESP